MFGVGGGGGVESDNNAALSGVGSSSGVDFDRRVFFEEDERAGVCEQWGCCGGGGGTAARRVDGAPTVPDANDPYRIPIAGAGEAAEATGPTMHPLTLTFGYSLEEDYQNVTFSAQVKHVRLGIVVGSIIYMLFVFYDITAPKDRVVTLLVMRLMALIYFGLAILATSWRHAAAIMQSVLAAGIFLAGLSVALQRFLREDETPAVGSIFVVASCYLFIRLKITYVAVASFSSIIAVVFIDFVRGTIGAEQQVAQAVYLLAVNAMGLVTAYISERYARQEFLHSVRILAARKRQQQEMQKSERLLLALLPQPIVSRFKERFKESAGLISDDFQGVTIIFAKVVNFSSKLGRSAPRDMVRALNVIFGALDRLSDFYGLEKIKTIGFTYVAVCGLPNARSDHADVAAQAALSMQHEMMKLRTSTAMNLSLRIGMTSGPVVGGVVGVKKFCYDLWGDAVSTAALMEEHGENGRIHITEDTRALLGSLYIFQDGGWIDLPGERTLHSYFVERRTLPLSVAQLESFGAGQTSGADGRTSAPPPSRRSSVHVINSLRQARLSFSHSPNGLPSHPLHRRPGESVLGRRQPTRSGIISAADQRRRSVSLEPRRRPSLSDLQETSHDASNGNVGGNGGGGGGGGEWRSAGAGSPRGAGGPDGPGGPSGRSSPGGSSERDQPPSPQMSPHLLSARFRPSPRGEAADRPSTSEQGTAFTHQFEMYERELGLSATSLGISATSLEESMLSEAVDGVGGGGSALDASFMSGRSAANLSRGASGMSLAGELGGVMSDDLSLERSDMTVTGLTVSDRGITPADNADGGEPPARPLNRCTLRFSEGDLERTYNREYVVTHAMRLRRTLGVGLAYALWFGILDGVTGVFDDTLAVLLRFAVLVPIFVVFIALSWVRWIQASYQVFVSVGLVALSVVDVAGIYRASSVIPGETYAAPRMVVFLLFVAILPSYKFVFHAVLLFAITAAHVVLITLSDAIEPLPTALYIVAMAVFGGITSYLADRAERRDFLMRLRIGREQHRAQQEQDKALELLSSIIPAELVGQFQQLGRQVAAHFSNVTVMVVDMVGFSRVRLRLSASGVVELLNRIFNEFDALAANYGLEKIKTFGDTYVLAAGIPSVVPNHADAVAQLALDIQNRAAELDAEAGPDIDLKFRIGIHSGPVVAGVVGVRKFLYDLWGDTVTVARGLERACRPGEIIVSSASREAMRNAKEFKFLYVRDVLVGSDPIQASTLSNPSASLHGSVSGISAGDLDVGAPAIRPPAGRVASLRTQRPEPAPRRAAVPTEPPARKDSIPIIRTIGSDSDDGRAGAGGSGRDDRGPGADSDGSGGGSDSSSSSETSTIGQ